MKTVKLMSALAMAAAAIMALGLLVMASCNEPSQGPSDFSGGETGGGGENLPNSPGQGGVPGGLNYCNDLNDNEFFYYRDGFVDRFGNPPHCTVSEPVAQTALGSVIQFVATGQYLLPQPDVYTLTVTTGGGSGAAQILITSQNGDVTGVALSAPAVVTNGLPIYVGFDAVTRPFGTGVVLYFVDVQNQFNLVLGETWTFTVVRWSNCLSTPDPGCYHPYAVTEMGCANDVDDDGNGFMDEMDLTCQLACSAGGYNPYWDWEGFFSYVPECNDGLDNDGDGMVDFAGGDPGCASDCDDDETDPAP